MPFWVFDILPSSLAILFLAPVVLPERDGSKEGGHSVRALIGLRGGRSGARGFGVLFSGRRVNRMLTLLRAALRVGMFLSWEKEIQKHGAKLPHWQQDQGTQFVTFRLGDALPAVKTRQWREERGRWLKEHPSPWSIEEEQEYHRTFTARLERWLDQGMGCCLFREAEARQVLDETLMRFQGSRVRHHAWVIMPNHVHLLFTPGAPLEKLLQAWKAHSARRLARGPIWQRNYRDTMIRDAEHFTNALGYIRNNPVRAGLREEEYTLWEDRHEPGERVN